MFITILSHLFLFLFVHIFMFFGENTGYKPYMYISPITERMRKRKAFADTELEGNATASHLFAASSLPSSSSVSNLTPSYSCLSMLTLPQNGHLSNIIDYHTLQQQTAMASENNNATNYLPTPPPPPPQAPSTTTTTTINDYQLSELFYSKSPSSSMSLSPPLLPSPSLPSLSPQHKIRIIDDAKLMYMRRQINEPPLIYNPLTIEHNSECASKPKLSFSIESIIGIK